MAGGLQVAHLWKAVVLLAMAAPVAAQEVDCQATEVQIEMTFCAEAEWMAADAELNAAYKAAMAALRAVDAGLGKGDKAGANYLRQAQRDWVSFRDNACAAEAYLLHGGSAEAMAIYGCRARLTHERSLGLYYIAEAGLGE